MVQEIITYIIVAAAFLFAILKVHKKFSKKKTSSHQIKNQQQAQHDCSACAAECILRDAPASTINNAGFCQKTFTKTHDAE